MITGPSGVYLLNAAYTFNGLLLVDIATQAINSIGWINDHLSFGQTRYNGMNITGLWIVGVKV